MSDERVESQVETEPAAETGAGADVLAELTALRARMLPMFEVVANEYATRTDPGYPVVVDNVEGGGYFGLLLDSAYGLYVMTDGQSVFAQMNMVGWRTDVRSSANKEKFTSLPFAGVRPVRSDMTDNQLRNLIAELLSYWNTQPLMIHITDS